MVGRVTNYDKLVLEIATDGSIEIQDALSYAVELLKIHVNPFTNIGNNMSKFRGSEDEAAATNTETENNIEDMKIEELYCKILQLSEKSRSKYYIRFNFNVIYWVIKD